MEFLSLTSRQSNAFCSVLNLDGHRILLDCGWDESLNINQLSQLRDIAPTINCVLISHASLYHMGALPYIIDDLPESTPIYCTFPVKQLSQIILSDLVHCNGWDSNRIVSISHTDSSHHSQTGTGNNNDKHHFLKLTFKNIVISANPNDTTTLSSTTSTTHQPSELMKNSNDISSSSSTTTHHSSLANTLKGPYPPDILLFNSTYTAHPYNFDTITRVFNRINDVSFGEETLIKLPLQAYSHSLKIKCAPAGRTLGGAIWYISNDADEITYLANISHQKDYHLNRFAGLKQYSSNKLLIVGNRSVDMRPYANFMTRTQWISFVKFTDVLFNQLNHHLITNPSNPSVPQIDNKVGQQQQQQQANPPNPTATATTPPLIIDPVVTYQAQLQQLYGGITLIQRDIRRQSFLDYVEHTMRSNKGSIFLPVQETVRVVELLCLLNNEWEGQDFTYPIIYIGQYAQELLHHIKSFMVPFSSRDIAKEKNPYSFPHIKTAQTYEQARAMVKRHYAQQSSSSTSTATSASSSSSSGRPNRAEIGGAVYITAVETSLKHGPTADCLRAFVPSKEDTILLTEIPFTAFDPYVQLRRVPYPEGCLMSFLYHYSTTVGLQYTTPIPLSYPIPGVTDNPAMVQQETVLTVPTTNFAVNLTASSSLLSPVVTTLTDINNTVTSPAPPGSIVGTGAQWEFKPQHRPRACILETLRTKELDNNEKHLLEIAWGVGLELEYHAKKQEFILNRRQQAAKQRFLSQNYVIGTNVSNDFSLFENEDGDESNNNTTFDFLFEEGQNNNFGLDDTNSNNNKSTTNNNNHKNAEKSLSNLQSGSSIYHPTRSAKHVPNSQLYNTLFGPQGLVVQNHNTATVTATVTASKEHSSKDHNNNPNNNKTPHNVRKSTSMDSDPDHANNTMDDGEDSDVDGNITSFDHFNSSTNGKRFKSTTLELFPALGSDLYVQLERDDDDNDENCGEFNDAKKSTGNNNTHGILTNTSSTNNNTNNHNNKIEEIQFLRIGPNHKAVRQSRDGINGMNGADENSQFEDLNSVPQLSSFNDVFGLSLNLESLLTVVEKSDNVHLSSVLEQYKDYKIQHEKNTLAHFELEQHALLSTPCPTLYKTERFTEQLDLHCKLITIPLTTYTDIASLSNFLQQSTPTPQRIITLKGHEHCRTLFQRFVSREVQIEIMRILLPQPSKMLFLRNETNTRKFVLDEGLLRCLKLSTLTENISIAPIRARIVMNDSKTNLPHRNSQTSSSQNDTISQLPLLTLPDDSALHQQTAMATSGLTSSVFLGKGKNRVTLNTLRDKLSDYGIPAELYRGWLICGAKGKCVVKKDNELFTINGAMCEDTFRIRDILYDQFEIL